MPLTPPGPLSLVPFVSVEHMMQLVIARGVERILSNIAAYVEEDFRRWELFDKTPRIASHSSEGVIELMPTSDGINYGFICERPRTCATASRPSPPSACSPTSTVAIRCCCRNEPRDLYGMILRAAARHES